jgi:hypothetical protein
MRLVLSIKGDRKARRAAYETRRPDYYNLSGLSRIDGRDRAKNAMRAACQHYGEYKRNRGSLPDAHYRSSLSKFFNASHAARCVACHGVRSHAVPVALAGEWSTRAVSRNVRGEQPRGERMRASQFHWVVRRRYKAQADALLRGVAEAAPMLNASWRCRSCSRSPPRPA